MPAAAAAELPADWRARLRRALAAAPDHSLQRSRPAGLARESPATLARLRAHWPATLTPAAVLVPIIDRPDAPTLLMTRRASHLRRHAGQICFPGGRLEAHDADLIAAAIRETGEEVGIAAASIEPIGFLSDHVVLTGYRITPVVALLPPDLTARPDGAEVAEVFELPLTVALDAGHYRIAHRVVRDIEVETWELSFGSYIIWGATAGILAHLREAFGEARA